MTRIELKACFDSMELYDMHFVCQDGPLWKFKDRSAYSSVNTYQRREPLGGQAVELLLIP